MTVPLPARLEVDAQRWAYGAALVNPHATISAIEQAQSGDDSRRKSRFLQIRRSGMVEVDAVTAVVAALVRPGRVLRAGPQPHPHRGRQAARKLHQRVRRPVGQREAEGRPRIRARRHPPVRAHRPRRPDRQAARRDARSRQAHPAEAARPGRGGPPQAHARRRVRRAAAAGTSPPRSSIDGIPWVIEVAVADTVEPGRHLVRVQPRPVVRRPAGPRGVRGGRHLRHRGGVVPQRGRRITGTGRNRAAVVHVICAAPQFTDKGKVALVVPASRRGPARRAALDKTTKTLRKEAEQRRKDASKAARGRAAAREEAAREERKNEWTVKDAVFEVLRDAKAAAGLVVAVRTLFYKVRPLVQKYTDKELNYDYFSQTLLPEYEREHEVAGGPVLRGARRTAPPPRRHGDPARHPRGGGLRAAAVAVRQGALHREDGPAGPARALPARPEVRHGASSTGRAIR